MIAIEPSCFQIMFSKSMSSRDENTRFQIRDSGPAKPKDLTTTAPRSIDSMREVSSSSACFMRISSRIATFMTLNMTTICAGTTTR